MGPFALAVPAYRLGLQQRKRKRNHKDASADSPSPSSEAISSSTRIASSSINPRSHSPDTLRQFALAGLSPEEDVPSNIYPNFPHKRLPETPGGSSRHRRSRMASTTSGSEADVDTDASDDRQAWREDGMPTNYPARMKHLNTMTAILHRCLHEGDITRARRAFSLLVRTRDIDIRLNNMWNIGSEILMRNGEDRNDGKSAKAPGEPSDEDAAAVGDVESQSAPPPPRWGSAANVEKVRQYLESLIQQHPYDQHRPRLTSAVDFWPALFSIEIYNVNAEFKIALQRLDDEAEEANQDDEDSEPPMSQTGSDDDYDALIQCREEGRKSIQWAAKDDIRQETRTAAQQIAARMDQVMENAPYATHHELLRLRGMLALYIGDLYLPTKFVEKRGLEHQLQGLSLYDDLRKDADGFRNQEAIRNREDEANKARGFFSKILEKGGELDADLGKFLDAGDED